MYQQDTKGAHSSWLFTDGKACSRVILCIALLTFAGSHAAPAQEDDPDELLVPPGLKRITETPPTDDESPDAATPRRVLGDDVETEIVGRIVEINDRILTIRDQDDRTRKFRIDVDAPVFLDDQPAQLRTLRPGDTVRLQTNGATDAAFRVRAASPPPSSDREPDNQLRQRRQAESQSQEQLQDSQRMELRGQQAAGPQAGGRVWMVMIDPDGGAAQSGMRPGDVILIVNSDMVQSENVLNRFNLPSGLFPLQSNSEGEVFIGPNGAGVGILGPGGVLVPTGVNISTGGFGLNQSAPNPGNASPSPSAPPAGDRNFGPPIGERPNSGDRNFGPPIGPDRAPVPPAPPTSGAPSNPPAPNGTGGTTPGSGTGAPGTGGGTN